MHAIFNFQVTKLTAMEAKLLFVTGTASVTSNGTRLSKHRQFQNINLLHACCGRNMFVNDLVASRGGHLKGHCHAIWQLYKKLEGVFASIEFQTNDLVLLLQAI